jgi:hypothetical protein
MAACGAAGTKTTVSLTPEACMRKFIAWQNVERYRRLLAYESTESRRAILEKLLAEEEEIWAGLTEDDPPSIIRKS